MNHKNGFRIGANLRSVCIGTTVLKIVSIPIALITAELLSKVATSATDGNIAAVTTNSLTVLAVMVLFMVIRTWANTIIRKNTSISNSKCRVDFLGMLLRNPLHRLFAINQGEINENINDDISTYAKRFTELIPSVVSASMAVVLYLLFLSTQSILVAVTLFTISLIQFIPPIIVKKYMQTNYDDCREIEAKITDHVVEAVNGYEMIKLYGLKQWWQEKLAAYHRIYLRVGNKSETTVAAQKAMFQTMDNILRFGTYALLGLYTIRGYCDLDVVVKSVYLSAELFAGVKTLFQTIPQFAMASTAKNRLNKWGDMDQASDNAAQPIRSITFQNVQYQIENLEILHNIEVQFQDHNNYLLTGANGAGKSALFHLMIGLVQPTGGQITCGDCGNKPISADVSQLLYIPQTDPIFHFSAETLFGMFDDALKKNMYTYATQFGLGDEHLTIPISELSGGERKKVFLSMGFGISPRWLLLDEPTNSLDMDGRDVLVKLIENRQGVLIISHDLTPQQVIKHILTLKGGCLAQ